MHTKNLTFLHTNKMEEKSKDCEVLLEWE